MTIQAGEFWVAEIPFTIQKILKLFISQAFGFIQQALLSDRLHY